jgi:hypothetical protein
MSAALLLLGVGACGPVDWSEPGEDLENLEPPEAPSASSYTDGSRPCPAIDTGYPGDELCIVPPPPEAGIQIHVGPTDYDDPDSLEPFLVLPGAEPIESYLLTAPNEAPMRFYRQHYRMRPGSHHLIASLSFEPIHTEGFVKRPPERIQIGGTQRSISDFPPTETIAPEDMHLARPIGARAPMAIELHYVNVSNEPVLREAWINLMHSETTEPVLLGGIIMIGWDFTVPAATTQAVNFRASEATVPTRVHSLFGHRHAYSTRFSAWARRGSDRVLVYEDYDWAEPVELLYNSVTHNDVPDPATLTPGGFSGILELEPGDTLEWECEIDNHSDAPITFGNGVYDAEMCNLFGAAVRPGSPPIWKEFEPTVTLR